MALNAAKASKPSRRSRRPKTALFAFVAIGCSLVVAAWITNSTLPTLASAALPGNATSFEDRFLSPLPASSAALGQLKRSAIAAVQSEFTTAKEALEQRWLPQDFRPAVAAEEPRVAVTVTRPTATDGIPLPRSRPAAADQLAQASQVVALASAIPTTLPTMTATDSSPPRPAERSAMQKFSDMLKTRVTLASLGLGKAPDLAALGYDNETAVYDLAAHAVYLPNGTVLEAHSGMGGLRDDLDHVSVPNYGATPPAVYSLKPREKDFHGVAAIRMTPVEGSDIFGRSGLLVHSYMLGPSGDSNGCISVREYDRFLKAFNDGQFSHIAVVTSVKAMILAQQNAE
jgi:type VI secretion system (T6SS) effector TldE1-like protein